jgi:DNA-binding transcriptional LysR family regulator
MDFEFRQLRFALAAAERRSFRAAAESLDIEQSSLSRQIRQMETRLGTSLFDRSPQGVIPTVAGEQFLRVARRILAESERLALSTRLAGEAEAERLKVGCYTSLNGGNLKATLVEYARRSPSILIDPVDAPRARLLADVAAGLIDIAIVTGDEATSDLAMMPLWNERVCLAMSSAHPLAERERVMWTDLGRSRLLLSAREPGPVIGSIAAARLRHAIARPTFISHQVSSEQIRAMAAAGLGLGLVCEACIGARQDGLAYRPLYGEDGASRLTYAA